MQSDHARISTFRAVAPERVAFSGATDGPRSTVLQDAAVYPATLLEVGKGTCVQGPTGRRPTLFCVLSGTARLTLDGGRKVKVGEGSAVLIPAMINAKVEHYRGASTAPLNNAAVLLPIGELARTGSFCPTGNPLRALVAQLAYEMPATRHNKVLAIDLTTIGNLRLAFSAMCAEIAQERPGVQLLANALLKTCLVHLHRTHFPDDETEAGAPRIAATTARVRADPGAGHTVDTLAREAGMSRSSFARHFTRDVGMSPMAFVCKVRLAHAAAMLQNATTPIKVIAAECGFASRSHFSREFRKMFGMDPSTYRSNGEQSSS